MRIGTASISTGGMNESEIFEYNVNNTDVASCVFSGNVVFIAATNIQTPRRDR